MSSIILEGTNQPADSEAEQQTEQTEQTFEKPNMMFVSLVAVVAALGGILFGFDTGVVSGGLSFIKQRFLLNELQQGWAVSSIIIGCIVGAAVSGYLGDRFGRKKVLIAAAVIYLVGDLGMAFSKTFDLFIIARIIGGFGIGITSALGPLYNGEIAPAKYRGRLVALNQLAIVTGIFLVYFLNMYVVNQGDEAWRVSSAWRLMFGLGAVPGLLFLGLLFLVPESPRWLIKKGRPVEALPILLKIHGEELARKEVLDIKKSFKEEEENKASLRDLFKPGLRRAFFIGVILAALQQVTGINAVMYYAPEIFRQADMGANASLIQTVAVGFVNLVFTVLSLWLVDKVGRKALLLAGSVVMLICLSVIGFAFHTGNVAGSVLLIFILLYVASFAVSFGAVLWVVLSEIFPSRIRAKAIAIGTMTLWICDYAVSQSFPPLLRIIGPGTTFWLYAFMALVALLFTWRMVPETKGKSLEQIESLFASK